MLSVIMLSVIMLSVIMLSVVVPNVITLRTLLVFLGTILEDLIMVYKLYVCDLHPPSSNSHFGAKSFQ